MRRRPKLLLGLILCGLAVAAILWRSRIGARREVWQGRSVRATASWPHRALEKMNATQIDLGTVDRIEVLTLEPADLGLDPQGLGVTRLRDLQSSDFLVEQARMDESGRLYRLRHAQRLFPSEPKSRPEHAVLASRMVEREEAQSLLTLWRAQAIDCDPPGKALCHSPNFSLGLYAGHRQLIEISLCWFCQTVRFFADGHTTECDLAVKTRAARMLRKTLKSYFPALRTEEDIAPAIDFDWQ